MPILINDRTIGSLVIRRTEKLRNGNNDVHHYEWELTMLGGKTLRGNRAPEMYAGQVEHSYADGAVELIKTVVAQIP